MTIPAPACSVDDSRWPPGASIQVGKCSPSEAGQAAAARTIFPAPLQSGDSFPPSRRPNNQLHNGHDITEAPTTIPAARRAAPPLCSICQSSIQADDANTNCSECHLPFHLECWEENLGCSAYGCSNVNALRSGPDIRIGSPPPFPGVRGISLNTTPPAQESDIPWEYLLLAASALGTLFGLMCFGALALAAGVVAVLCFVTSGKDKPSPVLTACMVMSVIGLIAGVAVSISFWF